jgi:hypothetical protein
MVFAATLLAIGWFRSNREVVRIALFFLVIAALAVIPVYLTGEPAVHATKGLPALSDRHLEQHADLSPIALAATLAAGVSSGFALYASRGGRPVPRAFALGILAAAIAAFVLLAVTANLGGKIRHSEIRPPSPAAQ